MIFPSTFYDDFIHNSVRLSSRLSCCPFLCFNTKEKKKTLCPSYLNKNDKIFKLYLFLSFIGPGEETFKDKKVRLWFMARERLEIWRDIVEVQWHDRCRGFMNRKLISSDDCRVPFGVSGYWLGSPLNDANDTQLTLPSVTARAPAKLHNEDPLDPSAPRYHFIKPRR